MTDKIKQAYLQNIALAANPEYFLPEMYCALGTESVDYLIPPVTTLDPKASSLDTGAPPLQQVSPSDGGAEVLRSEYNGILRLLSSIIAFQNKGGLFTFNENNTIGYKNGAVLYDYATNRLVKSLKDNNTANFVTDPTKINNVDWGFISVTPAMLNDYGKLSANNTWTGLNSFSQVPKVIGINTQGAGIVASGSNTYGFWEKYANGKIRQWGTYNYTNQSGGFISKFFPVSFTDVSSLAFVGIVSNSTAVSYVVEYNSIAIGSVGLAVIRSDTSVFANATISWIAEGY